MGTRHYQVVISKEGEEKIRQYGQWDGYPSGQGADILTFLRGFDLEKYSNNLSKIPIATDEQIDSITDDDLENKYPYITRDCGARIHPMIENGAVEFVKHVSEQEARAWCEGFYTINLKDNTFTAEFNGIKKEYKLNDLPDVEGFILDMRYGD
jgi:hypothetical protein